MSGEDFSEILKVALEKGVVVRFRAKGFSMSPFIRNGDILTVSPFFNHAPRIGEIVAFLSPRSGKLIVHRIIRKSNGFFFIKGDNVRKTDDRIPKDNLLGIVTNVERNQMRVLFGLGPERYAIVFLSRIGFQYQWLSALWRIVHPLITRDS